MSERLYPTRLRPAAALSALVLMLPLSLPVMPLAAQDAAPFRVHVRVLADSNEPIEAAVVRLLSSGETVAQRVTDGNGRAVFDVATPGEYAFSVERLGYAAWESALWTLDGTRTEPVELVVPVEPVTIAEIVVPTSERCSRSRPLLVRLFGGLLGRGSRDRTAADAARLVRVYEHAMQGLRGVVSSRPADATYVMRVIAEEPALRNGSVEIGTTRDSTMVRQSQPLDAPPAEILAVTGWMEPGATDDQLPTYHALTPESITSEVFTLTHCFQVVDHPDSGWVGLAFEPLPGTQSYDVRGVVWVDTIARLPQRIDFQYTRLAEFLVDSGEWRKARIAASRRDVPHIQGMLRSARRMEEGVTDIRPNPARAHPNPEESQFGGTVSFGASSSGRWDVTSWELRWPVLAGRLTWGGISRSGSSLVYHTLSSTKILHYSKTAQVIGIVPRRF